MTEVLACRYCFQILVDATNITKTEVRLAKERNSNVYFRTAFPSFVRPRGVSSLRNGFGGNGGRKCASRHRSKPIFELMEYGALQGQEKGFVSHQESFHGTHFGTRKRHVAQVPVSPSVQKRNWRIIVALLVPQLLKWCGAGGEDCRCERSRYRRAHSKAKHIAWRMQYKRTRISRHRDACQFEHVKTVFFPTSQILLATNTSASIVGNRWTLRS